MNVSRRTQMILGTLFAVLMAMPAVAEVAEIGAARDNTLFESNDGSLSSGAGAYLFAGRTSAHGLRRAVVAFDLSVIPIDATIDSIFLRVSVSLVNDESARPLSAHLLLDSWGEGSSDSGTGGSGAPAQTGDATWVHRFHPDQEWSSPGGDFSSSPSALVSTTGTGYYTLSGEGLAADVRKWIVDPESAHGWLLRGDESEPGTARRIDARENAAPPNRPTLIVYFTPDIDPVVEESWGRVKARF